MKLKIFLALLPLGFAIFVWSSAKEKVCLFPSSEELQTLHQRKQASFIVLGDTGTGLPMQKTVAKAIKKVCQNKACDFVLLLGDNFYPKGLKNPNDPLFDRVFSNIYSSLGLPFYAILGNHDVKGEGSAQVALNGKKNWRMPAGSYRFAAGPALFVGINTNCQSLELPWAREALKGPQPWKILFGHHPIYASKNHGDAPFLRRWVWLQALGERADLYLSGHDHHLEHLTRRGLSTQYLISGGGGGAATSSEPKPSLAESHFSHSGPGFIRISLDSVNLDIEFYDAQAKAIYRTRIPKTP